MFFDESSAVNAASRCLDCKNAPCAEHCPLALPVPNFVRLAARGEFELSAKVLCRHTLFGSVCGAVCPKQLQCEGHCVRKKSGAPVEIGAIERFVSDNYFPDIRAAVANGKKVAVVGAGISGLTAASRLAEKGCFVTVYEKEKYAGGAAKKIPDFRLSSDVLDKIAEVARKLNVKFVYGCEVDAVKLKEFAENNDAVYVAVGLNCDRKAEVIGENLNGVTYASKFLDNTHAVLKKTVVIGGGNVAVDCARLAKKSGAETILCYRRSADDMPAFSEQILLAKKENVKFEFHAAPYEIKGDGKVESVTFCRTKSCGVDTDGRNKAVLTNELFEITCDQAVFATGSVLDENLFQNTKIEIKDGKIVTDGKMRTSVKNIFAGGDAAGGKTAAEAVCDGEKAAAAMYEFLIG